MTCPENTDRNQKTVIRPLLTLTLSVALSAGCSHTRLNEQLDAKLKKMAPIESRQNLSQETQSIIDADTHLTPEQKKQLTTLQNDTAARVDGLWQKTAKLRSILIKDLLDANYNEGEVEIIKDKMRAIEDQRLDTIFAAIKKANVILNKDMASHSNLIGNFFRNH